MRTFVLQLGCKHSVEVQVEPDGVLPVEAFCPECQKSSYRVAFAESTRKAAPAAKISTAPGTSGGTSSSK